MANDDPEPVIIVLGRHFAPTASAGSVAAVSGDEVEGDLAKEGKVAGGGVVAHATVITAVALAGPAVRTQVLQMRPKYTDIIIDAGGRDTAGLRAALTVADLALVPFQPRSFDLWTLDKVSSLLTEAQGYRDNPLPGSRLDADRGSVFDAD